MNDETKANAIKAAASWCGFTVSKWLSVIGIHSWADASGAAAFLVSVLFIVDWAMKKIKARRRR